MLAGKLLRSQNDKILSKPQVWSCLAAVLGKQAGNVNAVDATNRSVENWPLSSPSETNWLPVYFIATELITEPSRRQSATIDDAFLSLALLSLSQPPTQLSCVQRCVVQALSAA